MANRIIEKSENILVASHLHPDGDALGSTIAIGKGLEKKGKNVFLYNESLIPDMFSFLPGIKKIKNKIPDSAFFDSAIILDCSGLNRTGKSRKIIENIPKIINIDHHFTNTKFGTEKIIEPNACATAEIVYRLLKEWNITFCKEIAYSIYTGIFTDTGSFRFPNTNKKAFSICMEMLDYGVSPNIVASNIYGSYSVGKIKLVSKLLDSIEFSRNGKISMMVLKQEMLKYANVMDEDISEFINYAENINDVKLAVFIKEDKRGETPYYYVSLRSDGSVNTASIAASYGGGGHEYAAGFSSRLSFTQLRQELMSLADTI
ncbi:MAG: hypothetical protein CSA18_00225 [Deltaproteobacteria bacterium]|nr:MAG: hypothetical protein CSA18_00225 [Deltaproteobacteria bacterium]